MEIVLTIDDITDSPISFHIHNTIIYSRSCYVLQVTRRNQRPQCSFQVERPISSFKFFAMKYAYLIGPFYADPYLTPALFTPTRI